jgi:hypothetical protein
MERNQNLDQRNVILSIATRLFELELGSDSTDVLACAGMSGTRDTDNTSAVHEIEGNNAAASSCGEPGKEQHVGVEESLASLPAIGRRCVNIEVPQKTNVEGLKEG